jgi:hypothetical protein
VTPFEMETLNYAMGWEHATGYRILLGLVGLLILAFTAKLAWKRDCSLITTILWLVVGAVLIFFAAYPQKVIRLVVQTEYMTRIRFIMGAVSVLVLLITFESIRRTHLQERYALLWVVTGLVILTSVLFPRAVSLFRAVTGMDYVSAIVAVAFTFLVLVAFNFSIAMSAMAEDRSKLAQRIAILEARLKKLETLAGKEPADKGKS